MIDSKVSSTPEKLMEGTEKLLFGMPARVYAFSTLETKAEKGQFASHAVG